MEYLTNGTSLQTIISHCFVWLAMFTSLSGLPFFLTLVQLTDLLTQFAVGKHF